MTSLSIAASLIEPLRRTNVIASSYSALRNNWNPNGQRPLTWLAGYLRNRGIEEIFLCGLARDFCVKWTAEDVVQEGFSVCVLWDLCRSIEPSSDQALHESLIARGVEIIETPQLYRSVFGFVANASRKSALSYFCSEE